MRQTNAYKYDSAGKTTKARRNDKTEQKAAYYAYDAWTGDTRIYTPVLERLVCFPLFGIKWKLKQRSSLGGKVLTQEGPFIAGRNNCIRTNEP